MSREIGSFIELQFPKGLEYYKGDKSIARLNTGRAAIWHAFRVLGCESIWIPYYQCDTVRAFLGRKGVEIKYYHIDSHFNPVNLKPEKNEAVLLVNYYGVMSSNRMRRLAEPFSSVIIDNSQAFFSRPLDGCMNVYSCRKFIGVPDGAYVIGNNAERFVDEYEQCYSSDTSLFMLQRIEYGCEGKAYQNRQINEHRIDSEDCMKMSNLTRTILDGTDYDFIRKKRQENFEAARRLFDNLNCLDVAEYCDAETVPMVYPLMIEDDGLLDRLQKAKHFQGHWWSYLCDELTDLTTEHWISRYLIPITIDQRYSEKELKFIKGIIDESFVTGSDGIRS